MKALTTDQIIDQFVKVHGERYDYSHVSYVSKHVPVKIVCSAHGAFFQAPNAHAAGKGCSKCSGGVGITQDMFLDNCYGVHGDRYDYGKVAYVNAKTKVIITCRSHGDFLQTPDNHRLGKGCPSCKRDCVADSKRLSPEDFIKKCIDKHGGAYDYAASIYTASRCRIRILCSQHGEFLQIASNHLQGAGCPQCWEARKGNNRLLSQEDFLAKCQEVHKGEYDYSDATYTVGKSKLTIVCKKHGAFRQSAESHMRGVGCPRCANHESKGERSVAEFIHSLGLRVVLRSRALIGPSELDIYIPEANLAIEFCGNYYHSDMIKNHKADKHFRKFDACRKRGIHLVTLYESEWDTRKDVVKKVLKTLVGRVDSKTYARKLICAQVGIPEARAFFEVNHLQGAPRKGTFYGLYENETLKACMGFAKGASLRGDTTTWELLRYASAGQVIGGASRLFKMFVKENNPIDIVSFSDNRWFSGGMYETLGFTLDVESKPDYIVWSNKTKKVYHKSLFQRKSIPSRINEFGSKETFDPATDPRTEREMTKLLNCGRIYDCGKKRWVWKNLPK